MFDKLEIKEDDNFFAENYKIKYEKQDFINNIEKLLIDNNNILSIFKINDYYNIYNKEDIEDDFIVSPLVSFNEKDDLSKIFNMLKEIIKLKKINKEENIKFTDKLLKKSQEYRNSQIFFDDKIKRYRKLAYPNSKESKEIYNIIHNIIKESPNDYEYADNFRFAKVGDIYQEFFYEEDLNSGCCGYYDRIIEHKGIQYKIGFNYGH